MEKITLNSVSFSYSRGIKIIDDLSIDFSAGDLIGLVGLNGSGKTTLIKLILGILKPERGKVIFDGKILSGIKYSSKVSNIVPENSKLFLIGPTVIEDLVRIVKSKETALNFLSQFKLDELAPKKIYHLSEGQRRLISIFNSLHQDKDLFILDEPTIGLDQDGINIIMQLTKNLVKKEKIVIIATNDVRILPYFNRIIGLKRGKVILDGIPNDKLFELNSEISLNPNQITQLVSKIQSSVKIPNFTTYSELNNYLKNK